LEALVSVRYHEAERPPEGARSLVEMSARWLSQESIEPGGESMERLNSILKFAVNLSAIAGLLAVSVGIVWYFFSQDARIANLETQYHALVFSSPSPSYAETIDYSIPSDSTTSDQNDSSAATSTKIGPLTETCANLADRVATAYEKGADLSVAPALEKLMTRLGCLAPQ
jgi:hypothetical protein